MCSRQGLTAMRERGDLRPDADPDQLTHLLYGSLPGRHVAHPGRRDAEPLRAALAHVESFATPVHPG
jgi:hypothetical protein